MFSIYDLFDEFETDSVCVSDFGIIIDGTRLDYVVKAENGNVQLWSGNPDTDKFAEEFIVSKQRKREILEEIIDLF